MEKEQKKQVLDDEQVDEVNGGVQPRSTKRGTKSVSVC